MARYGLVAEVQGLSRIPPPANRWLCAGGIRARDHRGTRQAEPNETPLLTVVALRTEWQTLTSQPPPSRVDETSW